jgi:hypothetical protein
MAAGMPLKTSFADGNVLPASDLNDITNTLQSTGSYPDQLALLGSDTYRRLLPFQIAAGTTTVTISAAVQGSVAVTFPATSHFTANPIVTTSCTTSVSYVTSPQSITLSPYGFTMVARNIDAASTTTSLNCHYHAIQMTSASSSG